MLIARAKAFIREDNGATAIEYGLLTALVAVAIIGAFAALGNSIEALFNNGSADTIGNQVKALK